MANDGKTTLTMVGTAVIVAVAFIGSIIGLTQLNISADDEGLRRHAALPLYDGETLRVQTVNGVITYTTWDGDEVDIEAVVRARALTNSQARRYTEQVDVDIARTADGVAAVTRLPENLANVNSVSVDFRVRVPETWRGRIELHTDNGSVTAGDLHGVADVTTGTGPITIQSHTGSLHVSTGNGAIDVRDAETVLDAYTANGSIRVRDARLLGDGHARTLNGTVIVRGRLEDAASLEVDTSRGSVTFRLTDPDVVVDLAATNGSVHAHADVAATVNEPDRLVGRIGSGKATITARSNNGSIELYASES